MDIIIYTQPETLEHKKGADGHQLYFWNLPRPPRRFQEGDRIYFATAGAIRGYFICEMFHPVGEEMIVWDKDSWTPLEHPIPTPSFQGFKYANKVPELKMQR